MFVDRFPNTGGLPHGPRPWRNLELEAVTPIEYRALFKKSKCRMGDQADRMADQVPPRYAKTMFTLMKCSVDDLGFPNSADLEDIYAKAKELKLGLCPDDLALKLRLEYLDQPRNEVLKIAMRPLVVGSQQLLFTLVRPYQLWLGVSAGLPKSRYGAKCQFVFVSRGE